MIDKKMKKKTAFLKVYSLQPKRFALFQDSTLVLTAGKKTIEEFYPDELKKITLKKSQADNAPSSTADDTTPLPSRDEDNFFSNETPYALANKNNALAGTTVELSGQQLAAIKKKEQENLFNELCEYLSISEKCYQDVNKWLIKRAVDKPDRQHYIDKCYQYNYINDLRFIEAFITRKKLHSPLPWWRIKAELKMRVRDPELIDDFSYEDRQLLADFFASREKKITKSKWRSRLVSRGFDVYLVKEILNEMDE